MARPAKTTTKATATKARKAKSSALAKDSASKTGKGLKGIPFPKLSKRPADASPDAWAALEKLLHATQREQVRARRWKIFFRLAFLAVFVWIVGSIIYYQPPNIPELALGGSKTSNIDKPHVAIIPIKGPVLGDVPVPSSQGVVQFKTVRALLKRAFANEQAKAIFLDINSPGGDPVAASYIYNEIIKMRAANPDKKVYSMMGNVGASAAYYIAAATDEIYAHPLSWVGSIGVISASFGFDELLKEYGIDRRVYHAGDNKAMLDPFSPRNPAHEAHLHNILDIVHEQFILDVQSGRGERISTDPDVYSGLIYIGTDALELGLVDDLGFFEEIVKDKTGLDNLVNYSPPSSLLEQLSGGLGASLSRGFWQGLTQSQGYNYYR